MQLHICFRISKDGSKICNFRRKSKQPQQHVGIADMLPNIEQLNLVALEKELAFQAEQERLSKEEAERLALEKEIAALELAQEQEREARETTAMEAAENEMRASKKEILLFILRFFAFFLSKFLHLIEFVF